MERNKLNQSRNFSWVCKMPSKMWKPVCDIWIVDIFLSLYRIWLKPSTFCLHQSRLTSICVGLVGAPRAYFRCVRLEEWFGEVLAGTLNRWHQHNALQGFFFFWYMKPSACSLYRKLIGANIASLISKIFCRITDEKACCNMSVVVVTSCVWTRLFDISVIMSSFVLFPNGSNRKSESSNKSVGSILSA